ncbi:MAG: WG repeat-containing protein [Candidatus Obscuribacterales bacterium]|nr:WG repeat-containing protein [Candidatus Obscuribacterales bacterium]
MNGIDKTGHVLSQSKPQKLRGRNFQTLLASSYSDGLKPVRDEYPPHRFGYVDKKGQQVIPCKFDNAMSFSEGLAPAKTFGLWGYIDKQGNFIIQPQFSEAQPFHLGQALVLPGYGPYQEKARKSGNGP